MSTGIISLVNSTTGPISPQMVWNDTNRFLIEPNKDKYAQEMGIEIDSTVMDLYRPIDEICPAILEDSYRAVSISIVENKSIGSLVAHDAPIAMTGAGAIEQALVSMSKIGIGLTFNEEQQIQYDELKRAGQIPANYVEMLTTNIDDLQNKLMRLVVLWTVQILTEGRLNWTDPRTNLTRQIGYNYIPELFPAPLTGARRWSQSATATGIDDITDRVNKYYLRNGFRPKYIFMRFETMLMLAKQASTRDYLINMGLVNATAGTNAYVTFDRLKQIFEGLMLPEIRLWDAQVQIEPKPGVFERVNVLNVGSYFFANPKMGKRVFGKVLEANGKPGIFINTDPKDRKATEEKVEAIARVVPFFQDPKLLSGGIVD